MQSTTRIFDRKLAQQRRTRAAAHFSRHDFLAREGAGRLAERISDINRSFSTVLCLGSYADMMEEILRTRGVAAPVKADKTADLEQLSFPAGSADLILLAGGLHQVNDVPGALLQLRRILKPDGLLLACFPGGDTLKELRESFLHGEMREEGGARPRIMPFIEVRDAGNLLQRTGFALPVADVEHITVSYESPLQLLHELRGMGETNCMVERARFLRRKTLENMLRYYAAHFTDNENRIIATFELVILTAWAPHESQQKPAKRGSGKISLEKIFPDKKRSFV